MNFRLRDLKRLGILFILALSLCITLSTSIFSQVTPSSNGFPVTLGEKSLFEVKAKIGSFEPEFRARVISERLQKYSQSDLKNAPTIKAVDNKATNSTDLVAGDQILMTLVEADAIAADKSRQDLAQEYVETINQAIIDFRDAYSVERILRGAAYAAIATVVLLISLLLINRLIPKLRTTLRRWQGTKIRVVLQQIEKAIIALLNHFALSCNPKDLIDERDLSYHISFIDIFDLTFSDHMHRLIPSNGATRCVE